MQCLICQSEARPVKYRSDRVRICQWCVTLLCDKPIDPDHILEKFHTLIDSHVSRLCQPRHSEYYQHQARLQLGFPEHAGFFESIFNRALVERRRTETFVLANELRSAEMEQLNSGRVALREVAMQCALGRSNQPKTTTFGYRGWAKTDDLIHPTLVKYVNAINLSLLAGATKIGRPTPDEWDRLRQHVLEQDRHRCRICDTRPKERHVHHIIPISKFGSNHPNNLITLCYKCHDKVHPDIKVTRYAP